ncbi:HNH endonuclease family protein [Candidatus Poriferisocius sp.]|uniref:HNH endonuclease family protein n=1 Tax=Candidatus Poriferisocius sp. TaxID=3101276 RepID=UPI003B59DB22
MSPHRPHLRLALEAIESALAAVQAGDIDCAALSDLNFVTSVEACSRLLDRPERAPVGPTSFSDLQRRGARLATIASFLLTHVKVIEVIAPNENYAFTLFEPLNTTGQPLTPIETLKPLVVQAEGGSSKFMGSPSAGHLEAVDRYLPEDLGPDQRARRLDALITSFALVERGEKIGRGLLAQRSFLRRPYEPSAGMDLNGMRAFSHGLATTANFLNDVWDDDSPAMSLLGDEHTHLCLEVLATTRHRIVIPLLVRFYERADETKADADIEEFRQVLRSVTAFWTLWRTALTTTSGIDTVHRRLIREGHAETNLRPLARAETPHGDLPKAVEVQSALRGILLGKLKLTSAEDWVNMVGAQSVYQTEKALARYLLLLAHDDAIEDPESPGHCRRGAGRCAPTLNMATWKAHYTIEHMAPQSFDADDTTYERAIYDDGLVDRLGNLLLLPAGINQVIGNRPWPTKRAIYEVLSSTDPVKRQSGIKDAGLTNIGRRAEILIESGDYMPFCQFVALLPPEENLSADFLRDRARRLARLAWDRLWNDLSPTELGAPT